MSKEEDISDEIKEARERVKKSRDPAQVLNGWKEIQKREELFFMKNSKKKFIELEKNLLEKNTYFSQTKESNINAYDQMIQKQEDLRRLREKNKIESNYCQKCPVYKNHCPHKNPKTLIKEKYSYPIISSSTYGWLPDIDRFKENYKMIQATKSFFDSSHIA